MFVEVTQIFSNRLVYYSVMPYW